MSRKASPTAIGAFVLGAIALLLGGLAVFAGGRFFEDTSDYVLYFDDAVTGLNPGAPVILGGVKVGEVTDVYATIDEQLDIDIPVTVRLGGGRILPTDPETADLSPSERRRRAVPVLIKRGMRAQLGMQSFVTGQLHVALVFAPDKEAVFRGDGSQPEIPTIASPLTEAKERLSEIPLREIAAKSLTVLQSIDRFVSSDELKASVANLNRALVSARRLSENLDQKVGPLSESAEEALGALGEDSSTRYALDDALMELAAAARSIRILAEYLERHPEALVAGKGAGGE